MYSSRRARLHVESLTDRIVPSATILNLTTAGAVATAPSGAIVEQLNSTAAGSVQTFVRMRDKDGDGTEQGYNTNARPLQFDDESSNPSKTLAITLGEVPVVTVNGENYLEFYLGVQQGKRSSPDVALDDVQLFLGNTGNLSKYNANRNTLNGMSPVFDLDSGHNVTVELNANLSSGTGAWNMALLVPDAAFASASPSTYVYLYSKFDVPPGGRDFGRHERHDGRGDHGGFIQWGLPPVQQAPQGGTISGLVLVAGTTEGISGVPIELVGTTNNVDETINTASDGSFSFSNLPAGTYMIIQTPPQNNVVVGETLGTAGGTEDLPDSQFTNVTIGAGQSATGYVFGDGVSG